MYALFTLDHEGKVKMLGQKDTIEEIRAVRKLLNDSYQLAQNWIMEQFANNFVTASNDSPPESMVQIICWRQIDE